MPDNPRCKVIRCSSYLFGKQMCQTNAAAMKSGYKLLWYCCTCIALQVLRYASQFVTLLAAHTAFVTAVIVSFKPLRSFLPPFRFIPQRSLPDHLPQGRVIKEVYRIRPFKSNELREAFIQVAERLGLNISKKVISSKCSLTKIF